MLIRRGSRVGVGQVLIAVLVAVTCALHASPVWSAEPSARPNQTQPATRPAYVPIIELHGDPAEIGKTHGTRLGQSIRLLVRDYFDGFLAARKQDAGRETLWKAAAGFEPLIRREYLEEIRALAAAAGIDPRDALLAQCFPDLVLAAGCSTITLPAQACADHVARFGRNLDFPSLDLLDRTTVVLVFHPKDGYAFASVGFPGMVGVLSGMNEHGLALANMEVYRPRRAPTGMPYSLLYRAVLERCRTVKEAIAFLEQAPRQSTNNLMLMDAAGDRAVAEITPEAVKVRRAPTTAALISTNHQRDQDQDTPGRCKRYDSLHEAAVRQFGRISEKTVEEMLAGAAQGEATIQSMIFEPASRALHIAVGANAPARGFVRLQLKSHLRSVAEAR